MKPLSKEASAALSALKATDPTSADEARVRKNLERTLGIAIPAAGLAAATTAATAQAATASATGLASLSLGAKVFVVVAALGVGSLVTVGVKGALSPRGGEQPKPVLLARAEFPAAPPRVPEIEIEQVPVVETATPKPITLEKVVEVVTPKNVKITALVEKGRFTTLTGTASTFDDVSEFMLALNNLVCSPGGLGRVAARKKDGDRRVELLDGQSGILEYRARDLSFVFANMQLKSTASVRGGVMFNLSLGVDLSLCNGTPRARPPQPQLASAPPPERLTEPAPAEPAAVPEVVTPAPIPTPETYDLEVESNFPNCDAATELRSAVTARKLLTADRAEEAVWLLGAYQRRCPSGQWSDEAWSVRIAGLCRLGRNAEVIGLLQWFSTEYPTRRAAVVADLRSSCSDEVLKHGEPSAE